MVWKIEDAVPVSITIGSATVTQAGFGTLLILSETIRSENRRDSFTSAASMLTAGYLVTDREYLMAKAAFDQDSKDGKTLPLIKVGRKLSDNNAVITVAFDANATAGTFTLDISKAGAAAVTSGAIDYDDAGADVETVLEAMANVASTTVTLLGTQAGDKLGFEIEFETADATIDFQCTAVNVGSLTSVTTGTASQKAYGSAVETWSEAYAAVKDVDSDFYVVIFGTETQADIEELAALTSAEERIFYYLTRDAAVKSATALNISEVLTAASYENAVLGYSEDTATYANVGWIGATLPDNLYSINTCYYPIVGLTGDTLTDTNITNLITSNINLFINDGDDVVVPGTFAGQSGDKGGITTSGQFIDLVVGKHFLSARTTEGVYALVKGSKKVPFTKEGFFIVETEIYSILETYGVKTGIIAEGSIVVTMPDFDTYDTTKKANRWLDDVDGDATLQGAISKISITYRLAT